MSAALKIVQKNFPDVTKIVDSRKDLLVEVNRHDVKAAAKQDHQACAMAVACKRKLHLDGIMVSINKAYLVKGNKAMRFSVPVSVAREIVSFDRGSDFVPGSYSLKAVPLRERIGARLDRGRGNHTGTGKRRVHRHITTGIRAVLGGAEQ